VTLIVDGDVFGQNGDSPFAFQIVGIKKAVPHFLVFTEDLALDQQFVNQRCLAVVDMGDDSYVSYFHDALIPEILFIFCMGCNFSAAGRQIKCAGPIKKDEAFVGGDTSTGKSISLTIDQMSPGLPMGREVSRFRKNLYRLITGKREFSKQFVAVFPSGLRPAGKRRISAGT
jgi:hypothetical protein